MGSLAQPRYAHTATLLQNGQVLVAGGAFLGSNQDPSPLANAELYNPVNHVWSLTGDLGTSRFVHTATRLANGKVLVAGGVNMTNLRGSELYNIASTPAATFLNISTRMRVQAGENALIGGFIVTGTNAKKVIIRGIGPSLPSVISNALADPTLQLFQENTLLATNDDWRTTQQSEIEATGVAPTNDLESAIVRTLEPGGYTAIVRGKTTPPELEWWRYMILIHPHRRNWPISVHEGWSKQEIK